jgi:pyruvate/2-oxoglutarate dehydrogenase complex dihydrolipoamide acyltransferase (E2) component
MAVEVLLPKIGFSMEEGAVAEWLHADGATVTEGETLFLLESDKSTTEVEAPASGVLNILVEAGEDPLPVGTVLGTIGPTGDA